jgi:hypothetical protein
MASIATYLSNKVLDKIFGRTDFTPAATLYLALYSVAPASDGSGGTELTGHGYARAAVTNNTTNFPNAASRQKLNGAAIGPFVNNGTGDWLPAVAWKLLDASSGGNVYTFGLVSPAVTITNFQSRSFDVGDLIHNLT